MTRQIKTSDQLNIEENHPNYWVVQDPQIPIEPKQNIVLKPNGLQIIARHYHQKYGITILAHQEYIKISALAEKIHAIILKLKTDSPALSKVGLIFISNDDPDDIFGHALPMIWEKD